MFGEVAFLILGETFYTPHSTQGGCNPSGWPTTLCIK
jgi:hypothetical protein